MDWRTTPRRLSCVLLFALAALPAAAVAPAPTAKTCEALAQWARDNRESLPRDYRGLLAFPLAERRAIYSRLTAAEKAAFWSDKIGIYLEEHPELSARQRNAIAEAKAFLQPHRYELAAEKASPAGERLEKELALFAHRMDGQLGEKVARELLYGLGPDSSGQKASFGVISCQCNSSHDCAPGAGDCIIPDNDCQETIWGCGAGGAQPCYAVCSGWPSH